MFFKITTKLTIILFSISLFVSGATVKAQEPSPIASAKSGKKTDELDLAKAEALYKSLKARNPDFPQTPDEDLAPHTIGFQVDQEAPGRVVDLYLPKTVWDGLDAEKHRLLVVYARSRVQYVKDNAVDFSIYPPQSPLFPGDVAQIQNIGDDFWEISVGHLDDQHYLDRDYPVVEGWSPATVRAVYSQLKVTLADPKTDPVYNSRLDGSVQQVKDYLAKILNDPDSVEYSYWGPVMKTGLGYQVTVTYRAKSSLGGYVQKTEVFSIDEQGTVNSYK